MPSWKPAWLSSSVSSTAKAHHPHRARRLHAGFDSPPSHKHCPLLDLSVREGAVCVKRVSTV